MHCPGTFEEHEGIQRCTYCGSITVEDAVKFLKQPGTVFSGSDWKYGWPHKYYIDITNPDADKLVPCGSEPAIEGEEGAYCSGHGYWQKPIMGKRPRLHFKFYNTHLEEASDELFNQFSDLSLKLFGIYWGRDEKGLFYKCPATSSFYGFQKAGEIKEDGTITHSL